MDDTTHEGQIAAILDQLEHCLIRLDALELSGAALRLDHAIEELRSARGRKPGAQPKQERPA
ncbi:hypothetical protein [Qipengyuania seohaensis]|uniref:hypothetical protein n=1 Tax=Qipengyuania seohaensis TaxID=266951 RepID=UPI000C21BA83|nr:hypothetical protein [Qipengyuania seohaensis]